MAMYLEFVVPGPPVSNQQRTANGNANLRAWRGTVAGAAILQWLNPLLVVDLKVIIVNFYARNRPSVDVDNMSKPILDALQNVVYHDDRQIVQAEIAHVKMGAAFSLLSVRPIIITALQAGNQFVYTRIEDPVDPFPLPQ